MAENSFTVTNTNTSIRSTSASSLGGKGVVKSRYLDGIAVNTSSTAKSPAASRPKRSPLSPASPSCRNTIDRSKSSPKPISQLPVVPSPSQRSPNNSYARTSTNTSVMSMESVGSSRASQSRVRSAPNGREKHILANPVRLPEEVQALRSEYLRLLQEAESSAEEDAATYSRIRASSPPVLVHKAVHRGKRKSRSASQGEQQQHLERLPSDSSHLVVSSSSPDRSTVRSSSNRRESSDEPHPQRSCPFEPTLTDDMDISRVSLATSDSNSPQPARLYRRSTGAGTSPIVRSPVGPPPLPPSRKSSSVDPFLEDDDETEDDARENIHPSQVSRPEPAPIHDESEEGDSDVDRAFGVVASPPRRNDVLLSAHRPQQVDYHALASKAASPPHLSAAPKVYSPSPRAGQRFGDPKAPSATPPRPRRRRSSAGRGIVDQCCTWTQTDSSYLAPTPRQCAQIQGLLGHLKGHAAWLVDEEARVRQATLDLEVSEWDSNVALPIRMSVLERCVTLFRQGKTSTSTPRAPATHSTSDAACSPIQTREATSVDARRAAPAAHESSQQGFSKAELLLLVEKLIDDNSALSLRVQQLESDGTS